MMSPHLHGQILKDIGNALKEGNRNEMPKRKSVVYEFGGIEVVVSTENMGSIITAHPGD